MPEISRFFGIVIAMYFDDHAPPHFHAQYGGEDAAFTIDTLQVLKGRLAPRARGLVIEWAAQHQRELMANWKRARARESLERIEPLR